MVRIRRGHKMRHRLTNVVDPCQSIARHVVHTQSQHRCRTIAVHGKLYGNARPELVHEELIPDEGTAKVVMCIIV